MIYGYCGFPQSGHARRRRVASRIACPAHVDLRVGAARLKANNWLQRARSLKLFVALLFIGRRLLSMRWLTRLAVSVICVGFGASTWYILAQKKDAISSSVKQAEVIRASRAPLQATQAAQQNAVLSSIRFVPAAFRSRGLWKHARTHIRASV